MINAFNNYETVIISPQIIKDAIDCIEEARNTEGDIYSTPLSIKELHEFLTVEVPEPISEPLEMRAL